MTPELIEGRISSDFLRGGGGMNEPVMVRLELAVWLSPSEVGYEGWTCVGTTLILRLSM